MSQESDARAGYAIFNNSIPEYLSQIARAPLFTHTGGEYSSKMLSFIGDQYEWNNNMWSYLQHNIRKSKNRVEKINRKASDSAQLNENSAQKSEYMYRGIMEQASEADAVVREEIQKTGYYLGNIQKVAMDSTTSLSLSAKQYSDYLRRRGQS